MTESKSPNATKLTLKRTKLEYQETTGAPARFLTMGYPCGDMKAYALQEEAKQFAKANKMHFQQCHFLKPDDVVMGAFPYEHEQEVEQLDKPQASGG